MFEVAAMTLRPRFQLIKVFKIFNLFGFFEVDIMMKVILSKHVTLKKT